MIELLKILAALSAMQSGPSPVHMVADQPTIKADRLDMTETTCFETMGTCVEFATKPYKAERIEPEPEGKCVPRALVLGLADVYAPGLFPLKADQFDMIPANGVLGSAPSWAPGYSLEIEFTNGCATRFEVKLSK